MSLALIISALGGGTSTGGGETPFTTGIVNDDGYYNAFLMMSDVVSGTAYGVYKKAASHPAGGPLTMVKTTDYGASYSSNTITVDGSSITTSTNHSFVRLSSGRMLISYRISGVMYFAYCDSNNHVFTSTGTPISPGTNYAIAQSPIKMVETSYGTVIFAYYQVGSSGNPNSAILMESSDNGLTWATKATVYTSNNVYPAGAPLWRGNEIAICETHPTGNETTSKWIAIVRVELADDGGTYYMKFNSADGANTWTQDLTGDAGSFVNDNGTTISSDAFSRGVVYSYLDGPSPVDIRLHNGTVYVVCGERSITYGYALKYTTATPDGAFRNKFDDWTRPVFIEFYNGGGGINDCGYPVFFVDDANRLLAGQYQVSLQTLNPALTTRRCQVETVLINAGT